MLGAALVVVVLAPIPARADERLLGQRLKDGAITALVKVKLVANRPGNVTGVAVDTYMSVVRLRGTVPSEADWAAADRLTHGTNGVQRVVNELRIGGS
jgi:osmotically-inducible protein OsmY